jgi:hypothetical protein
MVGESIPSGEPHDVPGRVRGEPLTDDAMLVGLAAIPQEQDGTREVAVGNVLA